MDPLRIIQGPAQHLRRPGTLRTHPHQLSPLGRSAVPSCVEKRLRAKTIKWGVYAMVPGTLLMFAVALSILCERQTPLGCLLEPHSDMTFNYAPFERLIG